MAVLRDWRLALRSLFRQPGFTLTVVGMLGVAIGANTAIFSLINGALLQALPFDEPGRLVVGRATFSGRVNPWVSGYDYYDYREQGRSFETLAAMAGGAQPVTVLVDRQPDRASAMFVSWDLFPTLRVAPVLGRAFAEEDAAAGRDGVVVISHGYWQRRFGGSAGALNRVVTVSGRPATIIGVMPATFRFMYDVDVWRLTYRDGPLADARRFHNLLLVGRLAPGATQETAQTEVDLISARLEQQYPDSNRNKALRITALQEALVEDVRPKLWMLMGAVTLVLLMACANVAGLLLARGQRRLTEVALRSALGASRRSVLGQFLTESLLLALVSGIAGLALAFALQGLLIRLVPVSRVGIVRAELDLTVLLFVTLLSIVTGLVFGVLPALRGSSVDVSSQLRSGTRTTEGRSGARLRSGLVVVQVALGVVLLIGASLLIRSLSKQMGVDPGFQPAGVLTAGISVSEQDYPSAAARTAFFTSLLDDVRALPGVEVAGLVSQLPIKHPGGNLYLRRPGEEASSTMDRSADFRVVLPGYFEAMRMPLVAGRGIADTDDAGRPRVMVITQSLAALMFPGENPLGQTLIVDLGEPVPHEVVGVVRDARLRRVTGEPFHAMYMSARQAPRPGMFLTVRTAGSPEGLVAPLRELVRRKDPTIPLAEPTSMAGIVDDALAESRVITLALALFSAVALALALVGLYSVLAYYVGQRRHELGVRMALGASGRDVMSLVLGRGLALTGAGLAAGVAGAYFATGVLRALLYETAPTDRLTFLLVPALFGLVSALACLLPAWRASRVNPVDALRAE
ncbi:MAG: ABC transporter permease [Acidobacteria bacterium]|nr:ABC transporter permease [Acidobacteriota bacterium]